MQSSLCLVEDVYDAGIFPETSGMLFGASV